MECMLTWDLRREEKVGRNLILENFLLEFLISFSENVY